MTQNAKKLLVSALIVTRVNKNGVKETLNVLAKNKSKFGFPGGKLEDGESPLDAVLRETKEELGVTPTNVQFKKTSHSLTPEGLDIEMHIFTGDVSNDIAPANEIKELHWLTYDEMNEKIDLMTPMTIQHVLPMLQNKLIIFIFYN